jgi:hypothetical protein
MQDLDGGKFIVVIDDLVVALQLENLITTSGSATVFLERNRSQPPSGNAKKLREPLPREPSSRESEEGGRPGHLGS